MRVLLRPRMRAALLLLWAGAITACGGTRSGRPSPRATPGTTPAPAAADPLAPPWIVQRTGSPTTQTIHVAAVIEARADSAPMVVDSVQSQLSVRWSSPSSDFPRRYLGAITDYRLSARVGDSLATPTGVSLPMSFTATQPARGEQPRFTAPDESTCAEPAAVLVAGVRDLWLALPDSLVAGLEWNDSTTFTACRDAIPLTIDVRRHFRVTGATLRDGQVSVAVERRSTTRLAGRGVQLGDSVTIEGAGEGTMRLEVGLATGTTTFATGEATLHLTLRGSRRTQELTQRSRISILDR